MQGMNPSDPRVPRRVEDIDWTIWRPDETAVLCFIRVEGRLLLIHKKTGLGAGLVNAPGGRIDPGESARDAAIRETEEEVLVTPRDPRAAGELYFQFTDGYALRGTVFLATGFTGTPTATHEADPFWCDETDLPFDRMWSDDAMWMPHLLAGRPFRGRFVFEKDIMLSHDIDAGSHIHPV